MQSRGPGGVLSQPSQMPIPVRGTRTVEWQFGTLAVVNGADRVSPIIPYRDSPTRRPVLTLTQH